MTSSKLQPYISEKSLNKSEDKLKELEILYQYAIYICIFLYKQNLLISSKKLLMLAEM